MPFKLCYLPSYQRCVRKLGRRERQAAGQIVAALLAYFQSGSPVMGGSFVTSFAGRSHRLVFKKLRDRIWESYVEGQVRVLTRLEEDTHYLVFAGGHDEVQRFLKEK